MNAVSGSSVSDNSVDDVRLFGRRYRLYLTDAQAEQAARAAGACRFLWNAALEQRKTAWRFSKASVWSHEQALELPVIKRDPEFGWLRQAGIAQSLQQTLRDLDVAYRRFFQGVGAFPRFKRKGLHDSFRLPQGRDLAVRRLNRKWAEVRVPKLGWCRFRFSRLIDGEIRNATISKNALGWHISFCVRGKSVKKPAAGKPAVGVDRGVVATAVTSDGEFFHAPTAKASQCQRLLRLERKLARQRKGSKRRDSTKRQIGKQRARQARRRKDFTHKLTTGLVKQHGLIVIEDLKVKNMTRSAQGTAQKPGKNVAAKSGLNRMILEQSWGDIKRQLQYKTVWYGSTLTEVPAHHTSQTCHKCHHRSAENRKSQAVFHCKKCGHQEHADINAAKNIRSLAAGPAVTARRALCTSKAKKREPTKELAYV